MINPSNLIPANSVRKDIFGISDMTLHRWMKNPDLNFPKPIVINKRNYWRPEDLAAFQERQSKADGKAA